MERLERSDQSGLLHTSKLIAHLLIGDIPIVTKGLSSALLSRHGLLEIDVGHIDSGVQALRQDLGSAAIVCDCDALGSGQDWEGVAMLRDTAVGKLGLTANVSVGLLAVERLEGQDESIHCILAESRH